MAKREAHLLAAIRDDYQLVVRPLMRLFADESTAKSPNGRLYPSSPEMWSQARLLWLVTLIYFAILNGGRGTIKKGQALAANETKATLGVAPGKSPL